MYEALTKAILLEDARVAGDVERIRSSHPHLSDAQVGRRLTRSAGLRCGVIAAVASAGEPVLGRLASTADFSFQALSLIRLAQSIALAHRRPTTLLERGGAAAAGLILAGAASTVRRGTGQAARWLSWRNTQFAPILSALAGGAAAFASAALLGRLVEQYLSDRGRWRW